MTSFNGTAGPTSATATQVVESFFSAMEASDMAATRSYLHPDIVWHNVSLPKLRGIEAVVGAVQFLERTGTHFEARIHHMIGDEVAVLTERTDVVTWKRLRVEFWVCGTFEMRDGKIAVWRDYFSTKNVIGGTLRGIVGLF